MADTPRVIVLGSRDLVASAAARLAAAGWHLVEGWTVEGHGWDLGAPRIVCVGEVASPADAREAIEVAGRGGGVVAHAPERTRAVEGLLDDLRRLGHVAIVDGPLPDSGRERVSEEGLAVLDLLADGFDLDGAAEQLSLSRRTVARRLAAAREDLSVDTTTEAVVATRAQVTSGVLDRWVGTDR